MILILSNGHVFDAFLYQLSEIKKEVHDRYALELVDLVSNYYKMKFKVESDLYDDVILK